MFNSIRYRVIFLAILFLPLFFISSSIKGIKESQYLVETGTRAEAIVETVSHRSSTDDDGDVTHYYTPTITFKDSEGGVVKGLKLQELNYKYKKGVRITVIYPQDNPYTAKHDIFEALYWDSILTIIMTTIISLIIIPFLLFLSR